MGQFDRQSSLDGAQYGLWIIQGEHAGDLQLTRRSIEKQHLLSLLALQLLEHFGQRTITEYQPPPLPSQSPRGIQWLQ